MKESVQWFLQCSIFADATGDILRHYRTFVRLFDTEGDVATRDWRCRDGTGKTINSIIFRGRDKGHSSSTLLFRGNCPRGIERGRQPSLPWRKVSLTLSVDKGITRYPLQRMRHSFFSISDYRLQAVQFLASNFNWSFLDKKKNVCIQNSN